MYIVRDHEADRMALTSIYYIIHVLIKLDVRKTTKILELPINMHSNTQKFHITSSNLAG